LQAIKEILSRPFTKREIKEREALRKKYLNNDSLSREPTEEELNEYDRRQAEMKDALAEQRSIITRKDRLNFQKGVINKKRIKQLEDFIRFESKPRSLEERFELNNLLLYGETYFYSRYTTFYFKKRYFQERDALILESRRSRGR
jgi:hypothetical protein